MTAKVFKKILKTTITITLTMPSVNHFQSSGLLDLLYQVPIAIINFAFHNFLQYTSILLIKIKISFLDFWLAINLSQAIY